MQQPRITIGTLVDMYKQAEVAWVGQCAPRQPQLWSPKFFSDFLNERREALAEAIAAIYKEKSGTE